MSIVKYVPNIFSLFRVFCVPFLLYCFVNQYKVTAFVVLFLGAVSDFLDGYSARKLQVESKFGELLDPIADKLFSNSVLWGLYFSISPTLPLLCVAVSLTLRDLILLFGASFVIFKKVSVDMKPVYLSKLCTTLVFTFIGLSVIIDLDNLYLSILGYICFFLVVITFFIYTKRFLNNKA